jgi:hypothetical protein
MPIFVVLELPGLQTLYTLSLGTLLFLFRENNKRIGSGHHIERSWHGGYSQFTLLLRRELIKSMTSGKPLLSWDKHVCKLFPRLSQGITGCPGAT